MNKSTNIININELIEKLNESYEVDNDNTELLVSIYEGGKDQQTIDKFRHQLDGRIANLKKYFEGVADALFAAGAFDSNEAARKAITIYEDDRQKHIGPDGVVPDDGQLSVEEQAGGIITLLKPQTYRFQAPIAECVGDAGKVEFKIAFEHCEATISSEYQAIEDLGGGRENYSHFESSPRRGKWLWVDGQVTAKSYRAAVEISEGITQEIQGSLLLFRIAQFRANSFSVPPPKTIGRNKTYNTGVYINSISARLAPQILMLPHRKTTYELDRKREKSEVFEISFRQIPFEISFRQIPRLFGPENGPERQAVKMFLRSFEAWSVGEKAMTLAVTLEGLLLDKKNKDDLSARLQDSVAYWIGGTKSQREKNRKIVSTLYSARSAFVHNGETNTKMVDISSVIELVQNVIVKAILDL
jgi:hypothetical protein